MYKDNIEVHIGDMVEFYNIHPIGGKTYGIIADRKAGELLDPVHPDYRYAIWRPLDVYYPIRSENRILKVIHNMADAKNETCAEHYPENCKYIDGKLFND